MIGSLALGMIHTCNILSSTQYQKLFFMSGSSAFLEGDLLTGIASGAKGIIKEIILESGSWTVGNAVGHLILSNVSGIFQAGEIIHDENGGASLAAGPVEPVTDGVGTPKLTTTSTPSSCRFFQPFTSGGTIQSQESGDYIVSESRLFLPKEAVIQEGDVVTSNVTGYKGPYKAMRVETLYELFTNSNGEYEIDHLEVELKVVKKRS